MIHKKDFIRSIGMPDEGFNAAIDRALLQIRKEERNPIMKKKLSLMLAAAIIAALILTGAALAIGLNLFEYFGKQDERLNRLAPQAALETANPTSVETEALGLTQARFQNAYYDGQSLIVGFTLKNAKRYTPFKPTPDQLARMEKANPNQFGVSFDPNLPGAEAVEAFLQSAAKGEPCGYTMYSVYPSDHCTTGEGVDLPPWSEYYETQADGSMLHLREFESPLPDAAQNLESIELHIRLWQMPAYFYFDGVDFYELYERHQNAGEITAVVRRTDAVTRIFTGTSDCNGIPIEAIAHVSAVRAEVNISTGGMAFPAPEAGSWYDVLLVDENGNALRTNNVDFDTASAVISFTGTGTLPEELTLYIGLDREGEFDIKAFMANAVKIPLSTERPV